MNRTARHNAIKGAGRGQSITELALIAPIIAIMLLGIVELAGAYGAKMDVQAAAANGARIGALEGNGGLNVTTCPNTSSVITDTVDLDVVRAVLAVHGLNQSNIRQIQVFKATQNGGVSGNLSNTYVSPFTQTSSGVTSLVSSAYNWPSCRRNPNENTQPSDSLGVHVSYTYNPITPLFGRANIAMDDTSIQRLNPTQGTNPCPISGIPTNIAVTTQDVTNTTPATYNDVLTWTTVPGAAAYAIYRSVSGVNGNQFLATPVYSGTATVSGNTVQQTVAVSTTGPITATIPLQTQYQLTATNFCGEGERSDSVPDSRPDAIGTATAVAAATQTAIVGATQTAVAGATQTAVAGATQTVIAAATQTAAAVPTSTPTATATGTPVGAPTATPTPVGSTSTPTSPAATATATSTGPTATATRTPIGAPTATPTSIATQAPTATPTSVGPTATPTPMTIDDSVVGPIVTPVANQFAYYNSAGSGSGSWAHCSGSGCNITGIPGLYNGTLSYDNVTGEYVTMSFTGKSLKFYGATSSNGGIGDLYIDGMPQPQADFYASSASAAGNVLMLSWSTATSGPHTFRLQVHGTKDPASSGYYVGIDRVVIS